MSFSISEKQYCEEYCVPSGGVYTPPSKTSFSNPSADLSIMHQRTNGHFVLTTLQYFKKSFLMHMAIPPDLKVLKCFLCLNFVSKLNSLKNSDIFYSEVISVLVSVKIRIFEL